nr:DUF4062 domain-containing protein [Rhodopirellula sp. JC740]
MAKTHTILEVFIASPGDVAAERKVLEDVVSEFNLTWGDKHKVRLELVKWETHSRPSFGEDAQDVINKQVGDSYDIFLGIMWGRFGTPTSRAESGTEEEFARAHRRLRDGDNVQIMFYFKDAGISPSQMDGEQIVKVQAFKKQFADEFGGLYQQFETTEEFQTKARIHLSKVVQDWLDSNAGAIESKTVSTQSEPEPNDYNPLSNLTALEDGDAEEGILDLVDRGTDAMDEVVQIVNRMGEATTDLGQKFVQRTKEAKAISAAGGTPDRKLAKRVVNSAANDLDVFVKRMSVEIPEFYKQNGIFTESFSAVAMISEQDANEDAEDVNNALNSMQEYRTAIESSSQNLIEFRQTLTDMPRTTTTFNQARRRAVAIMDDLLTQMRVAASQSKDIENLLLRLLKTDGDEAQ